MRELGATKGVPFLSDVLDGKVPVEFVGKCPHCNEESRPDLESLDALSKLVHATVDHRLKANEQAMKYGLGETKAEVHDETSPRVQAGLIAVRDAVLFFVPMDQREQAGNAMAEAWKEAVKPS